jgi:hypothetical protein
LNKYDFKHIFEDSKLCITGASALDANGNPVSASFVSESGFNPNAAAVVPAPEPSSIYLVMAGFLLMGFMAHISHSVKRLIQVFGLVFANCLGRAI